MSEYTKGLYDVWLIYDWLSVLNNSVFINWALSIMTCTIWKKRKRNTEFIVKKQQSKKYRVHRKKQQSKKYRVHLKEQQQHKKYRVHRYRTQVQEFQELVNWLNSDAATSHTKPVTVVNSIWLDNNPVCTANTCIVF